MKPPNPPNPLNPSHLPNPPNLPNLPNLPDLPNPPHPPTTSAPSAPSPPHPNTAPAPATTPSGLDTAAQLMDRISGELGHRLGLVGREGSRGPWSGVREAGREAAAPALVAVAHGSRDPRALTTVTALLDVVRVLRPGLDVRLGHIELNEPALDDTLAGLPGAGAGAVLVPLLLSRGHHVKRDIPAAAAAAARPGRVLRVAAPLGPHRLLDEALHARLVEAGWPTGAPAAGHGVVLAAAGSRDPAAAVDTRRAAARLSRRIGVPVVPAYATPSEHTPTTVPAALHALAGRGVRHAAVASYFTAPGRFATQTAEAAPWLAAAPLGAHPALAALLLHRYDQARAAHPARAPHREPARA